MIVNRQETSEPHNELGLEAGKMGRYKTTFEHIIPKVEAEIDNAWENKTWLSPDYKFDVRGVYDGTQYSVRFPHLRRGKHAVVGIVDLKDAEGEEISAVIRNKPEDALDYSKMAAKYPLVASLAPELYGISGNWVVMERLVGLELEELAKRLREDPDFRRQYVRKSFDVIASLAEVGLKLDDVMFIDGHNAMVDPEDASIRIVEQDTFSPTIFAPNETITSELFDEFEHAKGEDWRVDFAMQLLAAAIEKVGAANLYIKGRSIRPTNPNYRDAHFTEFWEKLSDDQYQKILDNPVTREGLTVSWFGHGFAHAFSDEALNAAKDGDLDRFKAVIDEGKYLMDVIDKEDPRYGVIVLPDDFN